jgi:hypothetical protein
MADGDLIGAIGDERDDGVVEPDSPDPDIRRSPRGQTRK